MRNARAAKLAEYAATYAILNNIGIHPTALIERRDSSTGVGVFARDACDGDTTLFVVPAHRVCAVSVVEKIGTPVRFLRSSAAGEGEVAMRALDDGIITFLTGAPDAAAWVELCWRLALERHRSYSHWWGWLQCVPDEDELRERRAGTAGQCRVHHTAIHPFYRKGEKRVLEEKQTAYAAIAEGHLAPTFAFFSWAVDTVLSRGSMVPRCWPDDDNDSGGSAELGVVPYVDLINGPDGEGRSANAALHVTTDANELPEWYIQWILHEAKISGRDGMKELSHVVNQPFCLCVSLTRAVQASDEVILPYTCDPMTTGVLSPAQDEQLTRYLKYGY